MPIRFEPHCYKFRTKLACEIAEIDPQRLNEAIAAKDGYKCAPQTRAGVAREYDEFDLIALYLFRFLTGVGYSQSLASMYACGVRNALNKSFANKLPERFDFPLSPFPHEEISCEASDPTIFAVLGEEEAPASIGFNVNHLRQVIRERMDSVGKRERNTFGDE